MELSYYCLSHTNINEKEIEELSDLVPWTHPLQACVSSVLHYAFVHTIACKPIAQMQRLVKISYISVELLSLQSSPFPCYPYATTN